MALIACYLLYEVKKSMYDMEKGLVYENVQNMHGIVLEVAIGVHIPLMGVPIWAVKAAGSWGYLRRGWKEATPYFTFYFDKYMFKRQRSNTLKLIHFSLIEGTLNQNYKSEL